MRNHRQNSALYALLLLVLLTVLANLTPASARPATGRLSRVVQPDGTVIYLRARGDEWSHWYETASGNRVAQNPTTKAWVYVAQSATGTVAATNQVAGTGTAPRTSANLAPPTLDERTKRLRAGAATRSVPLPNKPRQMKAPGTRSAHVVNPTGTGRIPILLVTFKDRPVNGANSPVYNTTDFQSLLFNTTAGVRSMANMYKQMSGNTFTVTSGPSGISGWWQAPENHDYYGKDKAGTTGGGNDEHPDQLVRETVQAADSSYNFGPYDTDNDGFVDCVFVVHQGADQANGGTSTDIWSHRSRLTDWGPFWWGDGAIETNDTNANGVKVKVNDYVICPEVDNPSGPNAGSLVSMGVFAHEYGHALGLPDLYDIGYETQGIGNWSLMSGGSNNGISQSGDCPAYLDAWSRWELGWLTVTNYTKNTRNVSFPDIKTQDEVPYLWTSGTTSKQYFLAENRQQTGFDAALPGSGILVYHCDDNINPGDNTDNSQEWWYNGTTGRTTSGHPRVRLIQGDNLFNLEQRTTSLQNSGDATDPFPGSLTSPVRVWDNNSLPNSRKYNIPPASGFGAKTSVGLRNISNSAATMTADIVVRADAAVPTIVLTAPAKNSTLRSPGNASGTANDDNGVKFVRVSLIRKSDNKWWSWTANDWGTTTYDFPSNARNASGTYNWSLALPPLADGPYEVHAQSVDFEDKASVWAVNAFTIDASPPSIAFDPLKNFDTVFNFEKIGGTVGDAASVTFQIKEGSTSRYWNGTGWVAAASLDVAPKLAATITSGRWAPTAPNKLPTRAQIAAGSYALVANAKDAAGNTLSVAIAVTRSALDTSPPSVTIKSPPTPTPNAVLTSPNLGGISGTAQDNESGISNVQIFIIRDPSGTRQFWNGSGWQATTKSLLANYNAATNIWGEPATGYTRPSGTNLPNGKYEIQVHGYNRENPSLKTVTGLTFSVDFHPIYQWTGATMRDSDPNNNSDSWDVAANWNPTNGGPFGVPGTDAIAVISNGDVVSAVGSRQIYRLDITNSTVNTNGMLITKALNQTNGSVNGGAININGGATWSWAGGNIAGSWTILSGANVTWSGTTYNKTLSDNTTIDNGGTVTWSGNALLSNNFNAGATINNKSGAVFKVGTGTLLGVVNGYGNTKKFNNEAGAKFWFTKTGSTNKVLLNNWTFVNNGEIMSSGGTVEFNTRVELNPGNKFTGTGIHQFAGGELILDGTTTINAAKFLVLGGTWSDNGNRSGAFTTTAGGRLDWLGGTMAGTLTLNAGGTMGIGDPTSGATSKVFADSAVFNNKGNVTWTGVGSILANNYNFGATWNNRTGSTFTAASNAAFGVINGYNNTRSFNNEAGANFKKTAGATTGATTFGWDFNNNGTATASYGIVNLANGGSGKGKFLTVTGTSFKFTAGTLTLQSGTRLGGTGKIQIAGATVNANGTLTDATSTGGFELLSGQLIGTGTGTTLTTTGGFLWTGGSMGGIVTLAAGSKATASGTGDKVFNDSAVLNNFGTFTWTGGKGLLANNFNFGATINNMSGAIFNVADGSPLGHVNGYNNARIFNNKAGAKFIKNVGTATTSISLWTFNNNGEIQAASGKLEFVAVLNLGTSTKFTGVGNIRLAGDVVQTAPVTSTGKLALDGGTLTGAGTTTSPATYTGVLDWTGGTLAGTLTLNAGSKINIKDPGTVAVSKVMADGSVLINKGTVEWSGKGSLLSNNFNFGATINNESGAVFRLLNDGVPFGMVQGYGNPKVFNNKTGALFQKSGGTGVTSIQHWIFNNNAEVRVTSGTLEYISRLNLQTGTNLQGAGIVRFGGDVMMDTTINAACRVVLDDGNLHGFVPETGPAPAIYSGTGLFEWTNGSISGTLTLAAGAKLSIHDRTTGVTNKVFADASVFHNKGQVTWSGSGGILSNNFNAGVLWNNLPGASFTIANDGDPFGVVNGYGNAKTFENSKGATLIKTGGSGSALLNDWTFNNKGDLVCNSGVLDSQTALNLYEGNYLSGLGRIVASAGTTALTGKTMVNGTIFDVSGGTLVGNANSSIAGGRFDWTGGTLVGVLTTAVGSNTEIHGTNDKVFADNASFVNQGTVRWYDAGNLKANNFNFGATFTNAKGATFWMNSPGTFNVINGYNNPLWVKNAGTLNIGASTGAAGIANIGWSFEQTVDGILNVDIIGATAATPQFDQLFIGGNAKLAGKLVLNRLSSYLPALGTNFKISTYGSRTGAFTSVLNTTIDSTREFKTNYNATDLTLSVSKRIFRVSGKVFKEVWNGSAMVKTGIAGVTIQVVQGTTVYATTSTDGLGNYKFNAIEAGAYTIKAAKTGYEFVKPAVALSLPTSGVAGVSPNGVVDFQTYTYQVKVLTNTNAAVSGVTIVLTKSGVEKARRVTNTQGIVLFEGLSTGTYVVAPVPQSGFTFDTANKQAALPTTGVASVSPNAASDFVRTASAGATLVTAPASTGLLSTLSGNAAANSIRLTFTTALDFDTAQDLSHYSVMVEGLPVEVQGISVQGGNVTLYLEEGHLHTGDNFTVAYEGLRDSANRLLADKQVSGVVR